MHLIPKVLSRIIAAYSSVAHGFSHISRAAKLKRSNRDTTASYYRLLVNGDARSICKWHSSPTSLHTNPQEAPTSECNNMSLGQQWGKLNLNARTNSNASSVFPPTASSFNPENQSLMHKMLPLQLSDSKLHIVTFCPHSLHSPRLPRSLHCLHSLHLLRSLHRLRCLLAFFCSPLPFTCTAFIC
jgi:hypothetical protein